MKKVLVLIVAVSSGIILSECKKDDSEKTAKDINELVLNAGHLQEPQEYDPEAEGTATTSTETSDGIEYSVSTQKYKSAKAFDAYKPMTSNKKSALLATDAYLGAIIQGKYWANDGDLISIGSFSRENMTITLTGINTSNSSVTVESPSMANMTTAITQLQKPSISSQPEGTVNMVKTEAYSQKQTSMHLGLKYGWVSGLFEGSMDFTNTKEKRNVYMYFSQVFYSIEAELPTSAANFFSSDVDVEDLRAKITNDNPAGYISKIDYGRYFILRMTSSYSFDEMIAALNVGFANFGANFEYTETSVLSESDFSLHSDGNFGATDPTTFDAMISALESNYTLSNLSDAVPIAYYVNYLDGAPFRTGEVVEYDVKEYEQLTENIVIELYFDRFYIIDDGDHGVLDNTGGGEFKYSITVKSKGVELDSYSTFAYPTVEINKGDSLKLDLGPYTYSIPDASLNDLTISVRLVEYDDDKSDYDFNKNIVFSYPLNAIDTAWTKYYQSMGGGNDCDANFYFKIRRISQ